MEKKKTLTLTHEKKNSSKLKMKTLNLTFRMEKEEPIKRMSNLKPNSYAKLFLTIKGKTTL